MPSRQDPVDLDALLRQAKSERAVANADAEARLDALLAQAARSPDPTRPVDAPRLDPLAPLRELFANQFVAVIEDLRTKYGASGVNVNMDAAKFLSGGRTLTLTIEFEGQGSRLEGTVMSGAIAFQQTRYLQHERSGITGSGPTLRTRDLNGEVFRAFLCERIATLVRSVIRHPT